MPDQNDIPGSNAVQATFSLQRIYLKDLSFESPRSPGVFQGGWKPAINLEINSHHTQIEENTYEVVLRITVIAKNEGDEVSFLIEAQQAGVFKISGMEQAELMHTLGAFCPNLLFPYVREVIDSVAAKGSFPVLQLAPVNFDAIYAETVKRKAQQAQQTAQAQQKH